MALAPGRKSPRTCTHRVLPSHTTSPGVFAECLVWGSRSGLLPLAFLPVSPAKEVRWAVSRSQRNGIGKEAVGQHMSHHTILIHKLQSEHTTHRAAADHLRRLPKSWLRIWTSFKHSAPFIPKVPGRYLPTVPVTGCPRRPGPGDLIVIGHVDRIIIEGRITELAFDHSGKCQEASQCRVR